MTIANKYLVRRGGQQYGPYTLEALQHYYTHGQILGTDLVWTDGCETWVSAAQLFVGQPVGAASSIAGAQTAAPQATTTAQAAALLPDSQGALAPEAEVPGSRPPPRRWIWIAGGVAAVAAGVVFAALLFAPKPSQSLDRARTAYLQRNQANFDKYVDVASVLGDSIDQIVALMMQQNHTVGLARLAIESSVPALKSVYLPAASRAVDQFIISGTLPQDAQSSSNDPASALVAGYVSAAMHKVVASQLSYRGVDSVSVSSAIATLNVRVATPLSTEPLVLKVRMQKADGYWRVVAIDDLAALLHEIGGRPAHVNGLAVAAAGAAPPTAPAPPPAGGALPYFSDAQPDSTNAPQSAASPPAPAAAPAAAPAVDDDDPIGSGGFITPPTSSGAAGAPRP